MAVGGEGMSTVATAAERAPRNSLREVWLVAAGHMMTHWYPATFYLLLPLIAKELDLSCTQMGAVLTCHFIAGSLSNVPGGMLVDAVDRKGLLMAVALFWVGVPYLLMGFSTQYWMLLGCAALVGIGNNLWHPTAIPLLARRFPERRGLVVSIHGMGGNVGDALAPLVVGAMLAVLSWRNVMVLNVIPGVMMSCVILLSLGRMQLHNPQAGPGGTAGPGKRLRDFRQLLANRTLLMLSAGGG